MGQIKIERNIDGIEGLCVIEPMIHEDDRGYFMETYNAKEMKEAGIGLTFVQDNESCSVKGVLRGLHYQKRYPQTKLIRVLQGEVYDVAVDLRKDSPSFGKHFATILSDANRKQLLIPKGCAHGFLVLSDIAKIAYKCDDFHHPDDEYGLAWNDPDIGILWPGIVGEYKGSADPETYALNDGTKLILSEKDRHWPGIREI
ncbi:MAG: dTDP-4-dehydrorhamnose 3,5-epimerase [Erysipelotrichaceae bacterium]|nr:dTDP-4-dehydrorhamnose 3,5-epimerase [Erysipelotrichaceae bacterium]